MFERIMKDSNEFDDRKNLTKKQIKMLKKDKAKYRTWERNLRTVSHRQDVHDEKLGVAIPSCNYDTYIIKRDGLVFVSTSRNHEWDFPDNIIDATGGGADEGEDDSAHQIVERSMFYDITNDSIHTCEKWPEERYKRYHCSACKGEPWSYFETPDGKMLCGLCRGGNLGKSSTKVVEELMEASRKNMSAFKHLEP